MEFVEIVSQLGDLKKKSEKEETSVIAIKEKIARDIKIAKARLTAKARKKGIWENFGQKEVGRIGDKYTDYMYTNAWDLIQDFDIWCVDFSLSDLKGI